MHWHPLSPYGCGQEVTSRKMVNHYLVYLSRQCSSIPVSFSQEFLNKTNVILLEYSSYSADLVPADFYLFPRLKSAWKGRGFCDNTLIRMRRKS